MPRATWEDVRRCAGEAEKRFEQLTAALAGLRAMAERAGRSDVADEVRFHERTLRRLGLGDELRSWAK